MISTRSAGLLIDTVVCLTLAKWETVSGRFGGYLIMTLADTPDNRLEMSVRSNEVRGIDATAALGGETKDKRTLILATVLGMVGTFIALAGTMFMFYSARRRMRFLDLSLVGHREEIITYILALSNVLPSGADTFYRDELSYIRTGDLLLAIGLRDAQLKSKCVAALRALLDADRGMTSSSADAIRDNLRRLGVEMSDADFQQLRANATDPDRDLMAARRRAATHFE
jgi:hypothetical protein